MTLRVCSTPGCPTLVQQGRCTTHAREADRARGSRQARGYDREHERQRTAAISTATPATPCARCTLPLGQDYRSSQYDHTDDRTGYLGLSHPLCNLSAAGKAAHPSR